MKIKLFLAFYAVLLTMCRTYGQADLTNPIAGLACRPFNDTFGSSDGIECTYTCPNGETAGPRVFDVDPSLSATKGDLDRIFCGIEPPTFTPAVTTAAESPTPVETTTPVASATATVTVSPTAAPPLLTGQVTMCDTNGNLISFRLVKPPPDLTGRMLTVQIAGQESNCEINPVNPSLITCTLPPELTFPAQVVVNLDAAVVNDFTLDGIGCGKITTPVVKTTP
jgi:hypothetical protein